MVARLVAAYDEDRGIGRGNTIAWQGRLPGEQAYLARMTTAAAPGLRNALVMGSRTYESLPRGRRPLPGRLNVVLTRTAKHFGEQVPTFDDLGAALEFTEGRADIGDTFIFGGGEVYERALRERSATELLCTRIHARFGCDVFLPPIPSDYVRVACEPARYGEFRVDHERYVLDR